MTSSYTLNLKAQNSRKNGGGSSANNQQPLSCQNKSYKQLSSFNYSELGNFSTFDSQKGKAAQP